MPRIATLEGAPLFIRFGIPLHVTRYQGGSFQTHYHRFLELIVVNADRGRNVIDNQECQFRTGQIYRLGTFHPHRIEADSGERCDYFNITFLPEAVSGSGLGVNEMLQPFYETTVRRPGELSPPVHRQIVDVCDSIVREIELPDRQTPTIVLGAFRVLLGLVSRYAGTQTASGAPVMDERVQTVLRTISERFAEPLPTRELAALAGTSPSRLAQLFRAHTGATVRETLLRRRLTEAKRLLATTTVPVTHVLYEAGFNDVSYFNRTFRKDAGMTPREFRIRSRAQGGDGRYRAEPLQQHEP